MKKIIFGFVVIVCLLIIKNFAFSIASLWQKQDLLVQKQKELDVVKKKNKDLVDKLLVVQSEQYVEEEARNKLFMIKPNEQELVIPDSKDKKEVKSDTTNKPYWQQWLELFF